MDKLFKLEKLEKDEVYYVLVTDKLEVNAKYICLNREQKYNNLNLKNNDLQKDEKNKNTYLLVHSDFDNSSISDLKNIIKKQQKQLKEKKNYNYLLSNVGIEHNGKKVICALVVKENSDINDRKLIEFITAINAILIKDKKEKIDFIYDKECDILDNEFSKNNYCDFDGVTCIAKRTLPCKNNINGCCYHFEKFGAIEKMIPCEKLGEKGCTTKCISCKLMTCDYIREKYNVQFKIKDSILLDCFFNPIQKIFIKGYVFKTKEETIKKLIFWSL